MRSRGTLNLWLANLAGFAAAIIVGMLVEILFPSPEALHRQEAPFMLYSIMAGLGTLVGTWFWLAARLQQPENLFLRHLFAGAVSCFVGSVVLGFAWSHLVSL
ncbi:hypothetical protein [Pseudomonas sp. FP1740]|uniref:hypothetical protein n=1 Tax=unclassified Pseudomonas TaxID=196821 RepID=UPI0027363913|nr:hypothetical protein [Pseudomonas sp. FP1740]WLG45964.1 hypothetical protein PSH69_04905 [Pseudomonas sp. FP1740]